MDMEAVIEELAHAERAPLGAIQASLAAPDEAVSRTVDIINRCADCDALDDGTVTEDEESALCILVHILGECGEPKLFAPLLRLLAGDRDKIDQLFGDMLTETVDKILISTFDGDPQSLLCLMNNPQADDFCRAAAFSAWTYLAAKEVWPIEASKKYLINAFENLEPRRDSYIWVSWLDAVAALGLEELVPMADQIFAELRFGVNNILGKQIVPLRQEESARDLRSRLDATDLYEWLEQQGLYPFEDTIAEVSSWHYCSDKYRKQQRREQIARSNFDTAVNPNRKVGHNDPCPCGSGKKYKKCCLQ